VHLHLKMAVTSALAIPRFVFYQFAALSLELLKTVVLRFGRRAKICATALDLLVLALAGLLATSAVACWGCCWPPPSAKTSSAPFAWRALNLATSGWGRPGSDERFSSARRAWSRRKSGTW
jgi:hypothetical protein